MPMVEEEIDGLSGLLFPFYDADTHMLYLAGKVWLRLRIWVDLLMQLNPNREQVYLILAWLSKE